MLSINSVHVAFACTQRLILSFVPVLIFPCSLFKGTSVALILSSAAINAAFHKTGDAILNMIVKTVQMKFDVHFTPAVTMNLGWFRLCQ